MHNYLMYDGVVTGKKKGSAAILVTVNSKYSSKNYSFSNSNFAIVRVVEDAVPDPVDIGQTKVALSKTTFTYNGKVQKPSIKTIKGIGKYTGTTDATYTINKAKNPITFKAKTVKVKDAGSTNYKASAWKRVTFKVRVK